MSGGHEFWIGSSSHGPGTPSVGVRRLVLDAGGAPSLGPVVPVAANPMFLASVGERIAVVHEEPDGAVSLWQPTPSGLRAAGGPAPTGPADPCHVSATPDAAAVLVASYTGGTLSVHPVTAAGVGPPRSLVAYAGAGPRRDRQSSPHPHQVVVDAARGVVLVPDLGTDTVHVHHLAALLAGRPGHHDLALAPGSGPRRLVVRDDRLVVANELARTISVLDAASGELVAASPATERPGAADAPGTSALRCTSDGTVLVGNRGPAPSEC